MVAEGCRLKQKAENSNEVEYLCCHQMETENEGIQWDGSWEQESMCHVEHDQTVHYLRC